MEYFRNLKIIFYDDLSNLNYYNTLNHFIVLSKIFYDILTLIAMFTPVLAV